MIKVEKYQGLGNDFIIVEEFDLIQKGIPDYGEFAAQVCNRKFGIGADGLLILKYVAQMPFMFYYNSDGSQAPMCGNGIRCFANYLIDKEYMKEENFTIKTLAGDMLISARYNDEDEFFAKINMGTPIYKTKDSLRTEKDEIIEEEITIGDTLVKLSYVFTGTDHVVVFVDELTETKVEKIGKEIENFVELFPKKTNVNFVEIKSRDYLNVITWERGAGLTLACGTGATASFVIANRLGYVDEKVTVKLPGGELTIEREDGELYMTGPSKRIMTGQYYTKR